MQNDPYYLRNANTTPQKNKQKGCLKLMRDQAASFILGVISLIVAITFGIWGILALPPASQPRQFVSHIFSGTPAATEPPTAKPSPTPTPKVIPEDLNIDCLNCGGNYALTVKLNTITIDYSHQQATMKFNITNSGSTSCDVQILKLEFQDVNGTIYKAQNVEQYIGDIAVGNPFIVNSIFDLLPRANIHYLLSTSLRCINELDYKTQDFVFN